MAEEIKPGTPEWEQAMVAGWRVGSDQMEEWVNGSVWVLRRGVDFPALLDWKDLVSRLRSGAFYRNCRMRIWRIDEDAIGIQAFPKPAKPCTSVPCPSWEPMSMQVLGICNCFGRIEPGMQYAQGCPVHDPVAIATMEAQRDEKMNE